MYEYIISYNMLCVVIQVTAESGLVTLFCWILYPWQQGVALCLFPRLLCVYFVGGRKIKVGRKRRDRNIVDELSSEEDVVEEEDMEVSRNISAYEDKT